MQKIDLATYKRKGLLEAFKDRDMPFFSTTSHVNISNLKKFIDKNRNGFFLSLSFLITKSVNLVPELRHRIIDGELFELSRVDPGYTVLLDDETFSFCDSRYLDSFKEYREYSKVKIKEVKECPDQGVDEKHHMFFITNIPWFSFTSIVHPYDKKYGSIPVIAIGKYFEQGNELLVPIGIQVNHGLVDGIHVGKFYQHLSSMCSNPEVWLK
ncbi:MAG: CatA-like O-acetyltransferase [Desulfobulbus sp.]